MASSTRICTIFEILNLVLDIMYPDEDEQNGTVIHSRQPDHEPFVTHVIGMSDNSPINGYSQVIADNNNDGYENDDEEDEDGEDESEENDGEDDDSDDENDDDYSSDDDDDYSDDETDDSDDDEPGSDDEGGEGNTSWWKSEPEPCDFCGGDGICPECGGSGEGVTDDLAFGENVCIRCNGSGECCRCHGTGTTGG